MRVPGVMLAVVVIIRSHRNLPEYNPLQMGLCLSKAGEDEPLPEGEEGVTVGVAVAQEVESETAPDSGIGEGEPDGEGHSNLPKAPTPPSAKFSIEELINGIEGSQAAIQRKKEEEQKKAQELAAEVEKIEAMTPQEYEAAEEALLEALPKAERGKAIQMREDGGPSQLDLIKKKSDRQQKKVLALEEELAEKQAQDEKVFSKYTSDPSAPIPQIAPGKLLHNMLKSGEVQLRESPETPLEPMNLEEALEMQLDERVTWLKFITPGLDETLFCDEKRTNKLSRKLWEMTKSYLRDPAAMTVGKNTVPFIADTTENSLLVFAALFESARHHYCLTKEGELCPWPPTSLESLDQTRKGISKALQYLVEQLGGGRTKLDVGDEYEGQKESMRSAFAYGIQTLLMQHVVPQTLRKAKEGDLNHSAIPELALDELKEFLLKAVELSVQNILPGMLKFLENLEELLNSSYEEVKQQVEIEFDRDLEVFFNRVAFGGTKTMNSPEELDNVCMNLAYKYNGYVTLPPAEEIATYCHAQDITDSSGWDLQTFRRWFDSRIRYRNNIPGLA